jgi:hypothetical protein
MQGERNETCSTIHLVVVDAFFFTDHDSNWKLNIVVKWLTLLLHVFGGGSQVRVAVLATGYAD